MDVLFCESFNHCSVSVSVHDIDPMDPPWQLQGCNNDGRMKTHSIQKVAAKARAFETLCTTEELCGIIAVLSCRKVASAVVTTGPPNRCTMFTAVVAAGIVSLAIDEYAAAIEGIPMAPMPAPRTKSARQIAHPARSEKGSNAKAKVPSRARNAPLALTRRTPKRSVNVPMEG